jgi:hypothetical protein
VSIEQRVFSFGMNNPQLERIQPMILNAKRYVIFLALQMQKYNGGGRPSLTLRNTPTTAVVGAASEPMNKANRLTPKPMTQEDVAAVRKLTGSAPFVEVKYV